VTDIADNLVAAMYLVTGKLAPAYEAGGELNIGGATVSGGTGSSIASPSQMSSGRVAHVAPSPTSSSANLILLLFLPSLRELQAGFVQ